jgi:serine O-acetyltransferase
MQPDGARARPAGGVRARLARAAHLLRTDLAAVRERDPAAHSTPEILLYQGLHAIWFHRLAHAMHGRGARLPARAVSQVARLLTGIEIHPGARIGEGFFIDHGAGVVIGETAEVGRDVTVYQGVTLGGTGKHGGKRHPTVGDRVILGTHAQVLGPLVIGDDAKIGAGSIVVRDVPARSTVVGNPGRPVIVDGQKVPRGVELEHQRLPDPVMEMLQCLVDRVAALEEEVTALREGRTPPRRAGEGEADCMDRTRGQMAEIIRLRDAGSR